MRRLRDTTIAAVYPRWPWVRKGLRIERDAARAQYGLYGFPRLVTAEALDTMPRFLLIGSDFLMSGREPVRRYAAIVWPDYTVRIVYPDLALIERAPRRAGVQTAPTVR